ncbi:hypothetical protein BDV18DRAFT_20674 [Aspergillus unguis]
MKLFQMASIGALIPLIHTRYYWTRLPRTTFNIFAPLSPTAYNRYEDSLLDALLNHLGLKRLRTMISILASRTRLYVGM